MVWRVILSTIIGKEEASQYEVLKVSNSGVSGTCVVIVADRRTGKRYAVKYGESKVPLTEQAQNTRRMAELFEDVRIPRIVLCSPQLLMMDAVEGETLQETVVKGIYPATSLIKIFEAILRAFTAVWKKTAQPYDAGVELRRDPKGRIERICSSLCEHVCVDLSLCSFRETPLYVNGVRCGELGTMFQELTTGYKPPRNIVECHGDPNADNIMIDSHKDWWLIDMEWAGLHDWRIMMSQLIGWWISNATYLTNGTPTCRVRNNRIELDYRISMHPVAQMLMEIAWRYAAEVAQSLGEVDWERQIQYQLGTLLLSHVRFAEQRNRSEYRLVLLGEAFKFLNRDACLSRP